MLTNQVRDVHNLSTSSSFLLGCRYQRALGYADIDAFEMDEDRKVEDNEKITFLLASCQSNW